MFIDDRSGGGLLAGVRVSLRPKGVQVLGQGCGIKNLSSLELVGEYYSNLLISRSIPPNTTSLKTFSTAPSTLSPFPPALSRPSRRKGSQGPSSSSPCPPKSAPASPTLLWSPGRLSLGLEYSLIGVTLVLANGDQERLCMMAPLDSAEK